MELCQRKPNDYVTVLLDLDELDITASESKATYEQLKDYILTNHGFKVSNLYIAQAKRAMGLVMRENYHISRSASPKIPQCPPDKLKIIQDALVHFQMV